MEIIEFNYGDKLNENKKLILCLGFFDGVHLGHQYIINQSKKEGYKIGVLTYDHSPSYFIQDKEERYLTSISDKAEYFESLGVDYLYLMHFEKSTLLITKDEFIQNVISQINPAICSCGDDHRFGVRGEGDPNYLRHFYKVNSFPLLKKDEHKVSSRDIISLLKEGNIEEVNLLLGRPYRVNGVVVDGLHNGRKIDFPTANLALNYPYVYPKVGVYIGYAEVRGKTYKAIISVGTHPTISPIADPIIEVNLLDFNQNIYGKDIFVYFIKYIRDEKRFENLEELKKQLQKDTMTAKKHLQ